jgi:hypothetical protein
MELSPVLETYFRGERQLGLSFVYTASRCSASRTSRVVRCRGRSDGKTEAQVVALQESMVTDASGTVTSALARMEEVNANWSKARLMWLVSGLLGALLLNFVRKDVVSAIGLALVFLTAVHFVVDELGERRAASYTSALKSRAAP